MLLKAKINLLFARRMHHFAGLMLGLEVVAAVTVQRLREAISKPSTENNRFEAAAVH